jgi:hypothetical protein
MRELFWPLLPCAGSAIVLSVAVRRWKPAWGAVGASLIGAAMLPALAALLCIVVFANAALAPADRCGVDACGMTMMAAMFGLLYAGLGFLVSLACALIVQWLIARR